TLGLIEEQPPARARDRKKLYSDPGPVLGRGEMPHPADEAEHLEALRRIVRGGDDAANLLGSAWEVVSQLEEEPAPADLDDTGTRLFRKGRGLQVVLAGDVDQLGVCRPATFRRFEAPSGGAHHVLELEGLHDEAVGSAVVGLL